LFERPRDPESRRPATHECNGDFSPVEPRWYLRLFNDLFRAIHEGINGDNLVKLTLKVFQQSQDNPVFPPL